jgi:hypothetical protein
MGCGCKKKNVESQPKPQVVSINGVPTPVVTQPAPVLQMMDLVKKLDQVNQN